MKSSVILALFVFIAAGTSCNLTRRYVNKTQKKYDKWGSTTWMSELDSASIYWRKIGSGDTRIVLIHGFGPVPQIQWEDLVGELRSTYTLYIPDLIYFGNSTSNSGNYDPRFLARKLYESFSEKEERSFHVVGVSYGGLIAAILANDHEDRVDGLVLIDALSVNLNREHVDSLAHTLGYDGIEKLLIPEDGKALKKLFEITFYKPPPYPKFILNNVAEELYSNQKEEKKGLMNYLYQNESEIKGWNFGYENQVLIIWGKDDVLIPVKNAYLIEKQYEETRLKIIPEAGHVVNMEEAEKVAEYITQIIEESQ